MGDIAAQPSEVFWYFVRLPFIRSWVTAGKQLDPGTVVFAAPMDRSFAVPAATAESVVVGLRSPPFC
jgi:hypothetical protein